VTDTLLDRPPGVFILQVCAAHDRTDIAVLTDLVWQARRFLSDPNKPDIPKFYTWLSALDTCYNEDAPLDNLMVLGAKIAKGYNDEFCRDCRYNVPDKDNPTVTKCARDLDPSICA